MTGILKNWITNKLGLEVPSAIDAAEFRAKLSNGVLIGEVLRKYGIMSDDEFVSLRHNSTKKHKDKNLTTIYNCLLNAGVDIPKEMFDELGKEIVGTGIKLLYELYLRLEYGLRKPKLDARGRQYLKYISRRAPVWMKEALESQDGLSNQDRGKISFQDKPGSVWDIDFQLPQLSGEVDGDIDENWFTTYDSIPQPESLSKEIPYIGDSECGQAENLYFAQRTKEFLKKHQQKFMRSLEKALECNEANNKFEPEFTEQDIKELSYSKMMKRKNQTRELRKNEVFNRVANDMNIFNTQWKYVADLDSELGSESVCGHDVITDIYSGGRKNPAKMKQSIDLIKAKRLKEAKQVEDRNRHRTTSIGIICDQIPVLMETKMEQEILARLTKLPASERMLADFIFNGHKEKGVYIQHSIYETKELQKLEVLDVDKEQSIRQHHDDFKESIVEFIKSDKPPVLEDEEAVAEAIRLAKIAMAEDILSSVIDLAINFSEYRSRLGGETDLGDHFRFGCGGSINGEDACECEE